MASEFPMAMFCEPQVEKCNVFLPVLTEKREILQPVARKLPGSICRPCSNALLPAAPWHWAGFIQIPAVLPCELIPVPHASDRLRFTTFFSSFCLASARFFNPLIANCRVIFASHVRALCCLPLSGIRPSSSSFQQFPLQTHPCTLRELQVEKYNGFLPVLPDKRYIFQPIARQMPASSRFHR